MLQQLSIDWTIQRKENNSFSQSILEANSDKIKGNCKKVYDLLLKGHRLTVNGVVKDYNISSLPRRVKDIEEKLGIKIKREVIQGKESKYVEYYL
jgi:hypothetical protein